MTGKHIGFVTQFALDGGSPHSILLTHIINRLSSEVASITVYTSKAKYRETHKKLNLPDNVKIKTVPILGKSSSRSIVKVLSWFQFTILTIFSVLFDKIDVLHVSTTPPMFSGFIGGVVKRLKKCKLIYHLQDIYPEILLTESEKLTQTNCLYRTIKFFDTRALKVADIIVVLSNDMKETVLERGIDSGKICIINNCSLEADVNAPRAVKNLKNITNSIKVVYAGNIGKMQNLLAIVSAFLDISKIDVELCLIGDGNMKSQLKELVANSGKETVKFLEYMPLSELKDHLSDADFGLLCLKSGVLDVAYPSKTWTYLSNECPLLAIADANSELSDIVNTKSLGLYVENDNLQNLENILLKYSSDKKMPLKFRESVYNYYTQYGTAEYFQEHWLSVFKKLDHH